MSIESVIDHAVRWAHSQVGQTGRAYSDSRVWDRVYPGGHGWAWCAAFTTVAYLDAGVDLRGRGGLNWPYYVPYVEAWARRIGAWKTSSQQRGDLVVFDWAGDGIADHIGIADPDPASALYRSVEGNTSSGSRGSQSNGGGVWVRYRSRSQIRGWVDMRVALRHLGVSGAAPVAKPAAPTASNLTGGRVADGNLELRMTGVLETSTIRRWQQVMGTPIDGVISSPSSALVVRFQQWLNRAVSGRDQKNLHGATLLATDGVLGPATWRTFQFWFQAVHPAETRVIAGYAVTGATLWQWCDGVAGGQTISALQWSLNASKAGSGALA